MTCWCKLLKGDLFIPLLLCRIQLYRTITIAAASTDKGKKAEEEIQEGERKTQAVGLLDFPGQRGMSRAPAEGLPHHGMHVNQGGLHPASNQLITAFHLIQYLLIECLVIC